MFGGQSDNWVYEGDTWELIAVDKPMILKQPESQYRRAGETATFTLDAIGPSGLDLSYRWMKDGEAMDSPPPNVTGSRNTNAENHRHYHSRCGKLPGADRGQVRSRRERSGNSSAQPEPANL
jgi:hypothetical protein